MMLGVPPPLGEMMLVEMAVFVVSGEVTERERGGGGSCVHCMDAYTTDIYLYNVFIHAYLICWCNLSC